MKIEKDCVVNFHYKLSEVGGESIEDSDTNEPMAYLHGHGNIISGLETALEGRAEGESLTVELPPEQAYGARKEDAKQRIPIKHIANKGKLRVGQVVSVNTDQGMRQVQILKIGKFNVDVDTNHPLAGIALQFDINIQEVRKATEEELSHGHAHGPGGHHH
jgi:FKBP-type peptidyl-prolyl cis-trans isomerase SlyD